MGGVVSYLSSWVYPAPPLDTTPDPATGLSEKDKFLIKSSWALVSDPKTIKENGVEFFIQLYNKYPKIKLHFPVFKGKDDDQLRKSPRMRAHASGVMYMLTSYVESMDDAETLVAIVQKMADAHMKRQIPKEQFEDLATMFVPFLKSQLGDQITPDTEAAWNKLLAAQTAIIKSTPLDS